MFLHKSSLFFYNAGKPLSVAHHDLMGDIEMNFTDTVNPNVNVVFVVFGHGKSIQFEQINLPP
jgi:N-acetyl-gamma-glutamyl-phosphate reductase